MSSTTPEPTKAEIAELRNSAKIKISQLDADSYDPRDVSRLGQDDDYVRRFLLHHKNSQDKALDMVVDTFKWRKENCVHDITADTVDKKFFDLANLFLHNRDTDGFKILMFLVTKHFKGTSDMDQLKRFFIYWLERAEREEYGKWITVFFDMRNTGMKNMDMEFIQYMINLFQSYYPWILNNIIVFEMPWLLNAMWKIIKTWLPPDSVAKIKFVDQKGLPQYVCGDQSLVEWGGSDEYVFCFEPEVLRLPPWLAGESEARKVHFSDSTMGSSLVAAAAPQQHGVLGSLVQLSPTEELVFDCSRHGTAATTITLHNSNAAPVFFKVKTTSPDKFRVRPSVGVLPGGGADAVVSLSVLDQAIPALLVREKFLVIAMRGDRDTATPADIAAAFKGAPKEAVTEVRLRVGVSSSVATQNGGLPQHTSGEAQILGKLEELLRGQRAIQDHLNSSRRFIMVTLALMVAVLVVLVVASNTLQTASLLSRTPALHDSVMRVPSLPARGEL